MTTDNTGIVKEQESLIKYPCDFPIKVMGLSHDTYAETIAADVKKILPDFDGSDMKSEKSKTGKYTALTVVVHVTSREELDNIYRMLSSHPMVKVVL